MERLEQDSGEGRIGDPVGTLSEIRARAISGQRLSGDEHNRLHDDGADHVLYLNMCARQRANEVWRWHRSVGC